ncbi:MAG TPA: LptA/OstA family protein [Acidobacteriaceae bacterium]|jgi:lipopolysaccharide export system protein LptA|nr:LptA/OstA family protein [Acidobacteriaceae bacterium]
MRITIERLRTWILVLAGLLIAVIAGFFAFTRYKVSHFGRDLPGKLGVNIQQDANGFTFSKSQGGHTLFTLHASKLVQYKGNGRAMLHNVSITLYGKDGSRNDHVFGNDFEYDPVQGVARALGPVHLDVQAPAGTRGTMPQNRTIRAETSGVVFNQKTGEANTDAPVTFSVADAQGTAVGASYDASAGVLILQKDVHFTAQLTRGALVLVAEHAEFNRDTRQLALLKDDIRYAGEHNTSQEALVYFREDGTVAKADATGHVNMTDDEGRQLHASALEVLMDANGNTQRATLDGGLLFSAVEGPHSIHGDANSGVLQLGPDGELKRVEMYNAVTVVDQEIGPPNDPHGSITREVQGSSVFIDFVPSPEGHAEAQKLMASGGAVLTEHTIYSDSPPQNTVMKGDQIQATLREGRALDTLHARGNTFLTNTNPSGVSQTSTGDTLDVSFAQEPTRQTKRKPDEIPPSLVEKAVQRGHVAMVQIKPGVDGATSARSQATAEIATLDGPRQIIHLDGSPRLSDEEAEMTAQMIDFYRLSGAVTADHDVKVTLHQGASAQAPVHAVAEKVFLDHDRDEATLYGGNGRDARLWQAANSVAAPTIVLDRHDQMLIAPGKGGQGRVHGVFADPGSKATGSEAVIRVDANSLQYSGSERKATFQGNVVAQQASGRLRADKADLFMTKDAPAASRVPNPRGSLDHMVAEGHVDVDEGTHSGQGERLVYTASDGRFILYGRTGQPARMADPVHGTVSGAALIFTNRGDSVEVDGGTARAITDTQVPK